jgi:hypothetical protein
VFAAVRQRFDVARDDELRLRDFPTLSHVIGWIREKTARPAAAETPAETSPAETSPAETGPDQTNQDGTVPDAPAQQ